MPDTSLNDMVSAYRANGDGRDLIMEKVAALVYRRHRKYGFDDEDDAANALLKFSGRIMKFVDRFEDRGVPFDAYLAVNLRYLARTVRRDRLRVSERETVCERAAYSDHARCQPEAVEIEAIEPMPTADPGASSSAAYKRSAAKRRPRARGGRIPRCPSEAAAYSSRIVFLAVKCAWEIDDEGISRVAASAGVGRDWLASAVEQARRSLQGERARVERLTERRNASWSRIRLLEARLAGEADPYRRSMIASAMDREEARSSKVRDELSALRTIVPNSVVARILGIPKGTVDSGLYYLRKRHHQG